MVIRPHSSGLYVIVSGHPYIRGPIEVWFKDYSGSQVQWRSITNKELQYVNQMIRFAPDLFEYWVWRGGGTSAKCIHVVYEGDECG